MIYIKVYILAGINFGQKDFSCHGNQLRLISGQSAENKWPWVPDPKWTTFVSARYLLGLGSTAKEHSEKNTAKQDACCETLTSGHTLAVALMNSWRELITHAISARPVQDQTSQHFSIDEVGAPEAQPLTKILLTFPIFLEKRESFFECVQSH